MSANEAAREDEGQDTLYCGALTWAEAIPAREPTRAHATSMLVMRTMTDQPKYLSKSEKKSEK